MEDDRSPELAESDVYALLAHRRRRLIVRVLDDFAAPVSTRQLTELVAGCETDDPTDETVQSVYLSLVHQHLPRLEDADVIAHDRDDGSVDPDRNFGVLLGVLQACSDEDDQFVG